MDKIKIVIGIVALMMAFALVGCQDVNNVVLENNDNQNQEEVQNNNENTQIVDNNDINSGETNTDINENYINDSNKAFKELIPTQAVENEYFEIGKMKLDGKVYDVKFLNNPEEGEAFIFYLNDEIIKEIYFSSVENRNVEEDDIFGYPLVHSIVKDIIIFKDKYLLVLNDSDVSSLTSFSILNSELEKLDTYLETDRLYEYKVENEKFYYSNNENDFVKGISEVDKYYRVNYVLSENNNEFNIEILNKDYENVIGPAGQS